MDLIDDFGDYAITEIQQALVSLINQTRTNTSILGFNKNKAPSQIVARNILD
jgi:FKBP-type peptidyl-prolyl cis-trans isomerase (trigger factor)